MELAQNKSAILFTSGRPGPAPATSSRPCPRSQSSPLPQRNCYLSSIVNMLRNNVTRNECVLLLFCTAESIFVRNPSKVDSFVGESSRHWLSKAIIWQNVSIYQFEQVNSPTESSSDCWLLPIQILSWRFCGGVESLKLTNKCIVSDKISERWLVPAGMGRRCPMAAILSHTKCFCSRFAEVNSPRNPSTYHLLLLR